MLRKRQINWKSFLIVVMLLVSCGFLPQSNLFSQGSVVVDILDVFVDHENLDNIFDIPVTIDNSSESWDFAGFELNFKYDPDVMTFIDVLPGPALESCGWEYLNYGFNSEGELTIVSLADHIGGPEGPSCYLAGVNDTLFVMQFYIFDEDSIHCSDLNIDFQWRDCASNMFVNTAADSLFVSYSVYDYEDLEITSNDTIPTLNGVPDDCMDSLSSEFVSAFREVDFKNGRFDIGCENNIDLRGDINLNDIDYEISDFLLFKNYFLNGLDVFTMDLEKQIYNSDINNNGEFLELSDLVFMYFVIIGDAQPWPKYSGMVNDTAVIIQDIESKTVTLQYPDSLSIAHLVFRGNIDPTETMVGDAELQYAQSNDTTRVLIYTESSLAENLVFGESLLFHYTGTGLLISVDVADNGYTDLPVVFEFLNDDSSCGDVNYDGTVNVSDAVYIINYVFTSGGAPEPYESGDANCDSKVNVSDAVYIINYVFVSGNAPCDPNGDEIPDC